MKKNILHSISLLGIAFFIIIGLASEGEPSNYKPDCDEILLEYYKYGYYICDSLPSTVIKQNNFTITFLDKSTHEPINGLNVHVSMTPFNLEKIKECKTCFGKFDISAIVNKESYDDFTNESGIIEGTTDMMYYIDKRDVHLVSLIINDATGKYSSKTESLRFLYNTGDLSKTFYLLNNEEL